MSVDLKEMFKNAIESVVVYPARIDETTDPVTRYHQNTLAQVVEANAEGFSGERKAHDIMSGTISYMSDLLAKGVSPASSRYLIQKDILMATLATVAPDIGRMQLNQIDREIDKAVQEAAKENGVESAIVKEGIV